jgi:DNA-directed RNA polymerase subunit RPC12/RpoP
MLRCGTDGAAFIYKQLGIIVTLQEIVRRLGQFGHGMTIYAEDPWQPSANAIVARPLDDGGVPDEAVTLGCRYFLEVFVALGVLRLFPVVPGQEASETEQCARLIEYAEWLDSDEKPLSRAFTMPNYPYSMLICCNECGKHFDIVVAKEGPQKYPCAACGKELAFDLEAFVRKAVEQTKKMHRKRRGRR